MATQNWIHFLLLGIVAITGCTDVRKNFPQTQNASTGETKKATTHPDRSPVIAPGSVVRRDVRYVPNGTDKQTLDLYAPAGAHAVPVIVYVHGGEWAKGDKAEVRFKPAFFNTHGVAFVSINYRLSDTSRHPAQVDDIASAVRWLRDHAGELGIDPRKIVLMGHSAGCHLATLVAIDPRPLARVGLKPSDLLGAVTWSGGAYDLVQKVHEGGMYAKYIRLNFGDDEQTWQDASPVAHVGQASPMPHFLFVSAENDKPASIAASDRMHRLVRQAGGQSQRATLSGKTHATADDDLGAPGDTTGNLLLQFIRNQGF